MNVLIAVLPALGCVVGMPLAMAYMNRTQRAGTRQRPESLGPTNDWLERRDPRERDTARTHEPV